TTYFRDPDIIAVDSSFNNLAQRNTSIKRLHTGLLWAEGPAWSAQGRYLVWSDIPDNRQMRWSEDDGHVSVFRSPSNYRLRLPGPSALLRASHAPRGALRARRHRNCACRLLQWQAVELAQRHRRAPGRQLLVH